MCRGKISKFGFNPYFHVLKLAGFSIVLIMAILGLKLDFAHLSLPLNLVGLVLIWLILHFGFMLLVARLLKTNIAWVAIGSMANVGGISTAPAVTAAFRAELMPMRSFWPF
ncbi:DUF819 family protein [Haliscomenobacter sp.]|uniref:DUF819 family protein n=1 Tax=Haliscomenobacter sp. TaxID=2717303 RepID=UPI003364DBBF